MATKRKTTKRATPTIDIDEDMNPSEMGNERVSSSRSTGSRASSGSADKNVWKDLLANPAVRYVAAGIATAVLTKVASSFSTKYPEISRFINENLENVEGRLADFKNGLNQNSEVNRHQ